MKPNLQRRRFMQALGAGAASLPFYRLLESSAVAGGDDRPLRVLLLYSGYGGDWTYLRPEGVAGQTDVALTPQMLTFPDSVLGSLADYADRMTILDGMAMTAGLIPTDESNPIASRTHFVGHEKSPATSFTGAPVLTMNDTWIPQGESLEQRLGRELGQTYVPSMSLGIGTSVGVFPSDSLSFNEQGQALPGVRDPAEAFQLLFGDLEPGEMPDDSAAMKKLAQDRRVVDALVEQAKGLRSRLAGQERIKLDEHLEALAELEEQLGNSAIPVDCGTPTPPSGGDPLAELQAATEQHFEVVRQAFACDRTRFMLAGWGLNMSGSWLFGPELADLHNNVAHMIDGEDPVASAEAAANMATLQRWYADRLKTFMDDLAATSDGAGTLLDNTLIVWTQDFGMHVHGGLNVPYILLGGAQGKLAMGRYLNYCPGLENLSDDYFTSTDPTKYEPHNRLLVSILNACGVDADTFGSDEFSGPLPGLNT